jgi:hypothetical protein
MTSGGVSGSTTKIVLVQIYSLKAIKFVSQEVNISNTTWVNRHQKPYKKHGGSQSCFSSFEIIQPKRGDKNKIERVTDIGESGLHLQDLKETNYNI